MSQTTNKKGENMTDKKWISIKYGPFGEQPVYYWFEPVEKEEEKHLMEMIGDWFGPPQIRSSEKNR